jgi:multidrug efflux pump subunit AcrB
MKKFFQFFAERHLLAILITLMIFMLGLNTLRTIRRDMFPEVDFGEMFVNTRYPGASPEDVELNVTNKIEEELKEVTGIKRMTSVSMENISFIDVIIDPNAKDQEKVKMEVRDAVDRVTDLPEEVTDAPLVTELKTTIFPVIEVGIAGDLPYAQLREIAKALEKKLVNVPGVSSVTKLGYLAREIKVEVSPAAMRRYQVPLREVIAAVQARNIRSTGGSFESYTSEKNLVTLAQFDDPMEVKEVIVRSSFEGPLVRIKDLAVVKDGFEEPRLLSRMNGRAAISFLVNKKETADAIRTVDAVKSLLDDERERLPDGVDILTTDDFSRYVRNRFAVVRNNGLIGLTLVLIVLGVFLNFRVAFWVAMGIPVSLLGVIFLLPVFGAYLDSIALAAMIMVIGIIVDDAIIIAENIQKQRERGEPALKAAVEGITDVYGPVLTTILTTFVAFAPLFLMTGLMGKFVFVIPLVISLALFISLIEATVALPSHLILGLPGQACEPGRAGSRGWFIRLKEPFRRFIFRILKFRYLVVLLAVAALAVSIWYASNYMKFSLFPSQMADEFYIFIDLPSGSSLEATSEKIEEIEAMLMELPKEELDSFSTRIGAKEGWYQVGENENWAVIGANLTPFSERKRNAGQIVEELRAKTDTLSGYDEIVYYIDAGGPPVGRALTLRVVGADDALRTELADSVVAYMASMGGIKDIERNDKRGKDQVEIKIDYNKLSQLGLTVADLAQNVRIAYDGETVTRVRYGDEDVDFRVMLQEKARTGTRYLSDLLIPNQRGRLIPLGEAAWFQTGPGPSNYYHFDGDRAITITADIVKGQTTSLEATESVVSHFLLDRDWPGMRFEVGGEAEETEESMASLVRAFILALVGIYFILILLFNKLTQPLMVMSAIPFGIAGVIFAFALHGESLGFVAIMGVIGLGGVVVNDSLVLVNHINKLQAGRPDENIKEVVARGSADRLRAVVLTTLTTVGGVLPLAYGLGGNDAYMAPMCLALAYGLMFATPITLILVPSLYVIRHDIGSILLRLGEKMGIKRACPEPKDLSE